MALTTAPAEASTHVRVRTVSPLAIPIGLKTGVNRASKDYTAFQARLNSEFETVILPQSMGRSTEYESIDEDSFDHRLFVWKNDSLADNVEIHVFPNNMGIAVVDLELDIDLNINLNPEANAGATAKLLEQLAQEQSAALISKVYNTFVERLRRICDEGHGDYYRFLADEYSEPTLFWVSRAILLNRTDLSDHKQQALLKQWLEHTYRPEDADDLINGRLNHSISWLNYAIVDPAPRDDERLDAIVLAQYYYAAQESCNKLLKEAIASAYHHGKNNQAKTKNAQRLLSRSRVVTRLLQVDYHDHLQYLTRSKRVVLKHILACWNYDQLTENGQRMIEICTSKIDETENEKRERSSLLTDLLLVALSFFTVFELSLYLTELSREMMSRPTLDFNDDSRSFMLQFIAEIDTDVMFGSGFFLTLLLVFIYKIIKSR